MFCCTELMSVIIFIIVAIYCSWCDILCHCLTGVNTSVAERAES